ncbi:hypothetical protein DSS3PM1_00049 [Bacteriophage DSS3_PM1]|nr:hypothetical protein DSS3PM1_00049 [Bacteriophage DSS3_PM1]
MKGNASDILSILAQDNVGFFSLVELNWNQNHYFTDFGANITWNGKTFLSNNPLVSSDPIRYSNVVDRESFRFFLSGVDAAINNELDAGVVHRPVTLRMAFTVDGVPQLGGNQTLLYYDGLVSKTDKKISLDDRINVIECTAPLSDLDAIGTMFTTKDGMKRFDPTDTSFDAIFEGSEETSLKWGKL